MHFYFPWNDDGTTLKLCRTITASQWSHDKQMMVKRMWKRCWGTWTTPCFFQLTISRRVQARCCHVTCTAYGESSGLVILGDSAEAVEKTSVRIRRRAAIISWRKIRSSVMMQVLRGADWPSQLSILHNGISVQYICQRDAAQLWL